jgi:FixJ family two-component response regulator
MSQTTYLPSPKDTSADQAERYIATMSVPDAVRVAIIDDDEIQCRSLARLVRSAGFQPLTFPSAEDFLATGGRASFRCLLLDIQLGGISGIALHRRLLAEGDRTPVVYITGHDDPMTLTEARNTGCAGFLRKTDPSTAIIEALRRITSGSLTPVLPAN